MKKNITWDDLSFNNSLEKLIRIMKIYILLSVMTILQLNAANTYSQNARVNLNIKDGTLEEVFKAIENQSDFEFLYNNKQLNVNQPVSIDGKNMLIADVLNNVLSGKSVSYQVIDKRIVLVQQDSYESKLLNVLKMQQQKITGKVKDATTGEPLPGVNVLIEGTLVGVITDADGKYTIEVAAGSTLVFSYVGFLTEKVLVSSQSTIDINLVADIQNLEEVVVIGYGIQKKSLVTGAISSLKEEQLASVSSTRVEQALQGRIAGVTVTPNSGSPGSSMRVRVRGAGSNGNSEPLYIVDGIRAGNIENLDPSEIASIEVLKDAASAAIYGAEGANGVVMITTKTGKKGTAPGIDFSAQYGTQSLGRTMKMMDAEQYAQYLDEAGMSGGPDPNNMSGVNSTDWIKEVFQPAPVQRYSLNVTGGNEKSSYLVGGSVFSQQGIAGGDKALFNRYTFRLNSDHNIKPWLNIGNRLSFSHVRQSGIQEDSEFGAVLNSAILMDPVTPVIYTDGLSDRAQGALNDGYTLVKDNDGNYYGVSDYVINEIANPLAQIQITHNENIRNEITGNFFLEIEPLKGLKFTSRFGINVNFGTDHSWNPTYWFTGQRLNTSANVADYYDNGSGWQWENFLTYGKSFGNHNLNLMGGMSSLKNNFKNLSGTSSGMFREEDKFAYHSFTPDNVDRVAGDEVTTSMASYYGRLSYDFSGKYLINTTVRRDGSSLLPPGNKWGTFPSVSAGWVVSKEGFFASHLINNLKIRASWGQNGNLSNLYVGQWAALITSQGIRYPNTLGTFLIGAEPATLPNYDLKWETSEQTDIGIDLGFMDNRLTITADYFNKLTKDLLTPGAPPNFAGFALPTVNGGNVKNSGFEFEAAFQNSEHPFKYEISANFATIKNKATYLNPNYPVIPGVGVGTGWTATAFEEGYPLWYFRGYKTDGIFQNQQQIDNYIEANGLTGYDPKPGDPIVRDVNKDGIISPDDHTYIGSPYPDFTFGARLEMRYKGFDFMVFAQGQIGNEILMGFNRIDQTLTNKPEFFYKDRWTGEGSTNTWFAANTNDAFIYNSDLMIFDGSYMRIRQLQLGYTIPKTMLQKIGINSLRLYVSLDDYFTFTKYPGLDPEGGTYNQAGLGIDRGVYPVPRKMMVGLTFNL
jgi:TonB-linked SusC/RagA family outer membrane protein